MVQPSNELFSSVTGSFSIGEGSQVQQLDTLSFLAGRELLPSGVSLHQQCNLLFRGKPDFFFGQAICVHDGFSLIVAIVYSSPYFSFFHIRFYHLHSVQDAM
jgi:hypothetical protein